MKVHGSRDSDYMNLRPWNPKVSDNFVYHVADIGNWKGDDGMRLLIVSDHLLINVRTEDVNLDAAVPLIAIIHAMQEQSKREGN